MQKDVIIRMILVLAIATTAFSCTSFQEEEVPVKFGVDSEELSFSTDAEIQSVTVCSGSKWDVTNMPSWLSLEAISPSGLSLYEWKVSFSASANTEYNREGTASFKAGTETIDLPVKQEGKKGEYVAVASVSISPTELTITEGDIRPLTVTIIPSNASDKSTTWFSNNTSVATVSSAGVVTAKAVGEARVFVQTNDGKFTANCFVSVKSKKVSVTGVSLDKTSLSMTVGDSQMLSATVTPSNATDKSVEWSSDNKDVAVVVLTSEGRAVYAQSPGTATITVKTNDGGKTATCKVTVNAKTISVSGVSLNKTSLTLTEGNTYSLVPTITPSNASNQSVNWSSSNTSVATVSSSGVITAKAAGTATITVTTNDGAKTATCTVAVQAKTIAVTGINLNKTSLYMIEGETQTLTATIIPSNATNKAIIWSSNNTSVATVSSSGIVTAKAAGSATIKVTTTDGSKTASCSVIVTSFDYVVDGVDYGPGIVIDGIMWAPVNCGYDSNHRYGLLYQWGRKYGQGYNDGKSFQSETKPTFQLGPVSLSTGESINNNTVFYYVLTTFGFWSTEESFTLWNWGTESNPQKTQYDPCPTGWRVPTYKELSSLAANHSQVYSKNGVKGMFFSGSSTYQSESNSVFLPLGGCIDYDYVYCRDRDNNGGYWSSLAHNNSYFTPSLGLSFGLTTDGSSFVNPIGPNDYFGTSGSYGRSIRCVKE